MTGHLLFVHSFLCGFESMTRKFAFYSPNAVAEHAVSLACTLNRRLHLYYNHVRDGGHQQVGPYCPPGRELCGRTCGIVGTGEVQDPKP